MSGSTKIVAIICLIAVVVLLICSFGYSGYKGDYQGAYTLVYTQVPDTRGALQWGPGFSDPQLLLLEKDSEGRGLYLYLEDTKGPLSIVILQKESDDKVYFYPEKSALSFKTPESIYDIDNDKLPEDKLLSLYRELCSEAVLAEFKSTNDWDKPMDEEKLDSADIKLKTLSVPWDYRTDKINLSDGTWKEHMLSTAVKNGHNVPESFLDGYSGMNIYESWMATDSYGRRLYYIESQYYVHSEQGAYPSSVEEYYLEMLAIINPDGSFDEEIFMIEIADKYNWQDQLKALKEANGWNRPFDEEVSG